MTPLLLERAHEQLDVQAQHGNWNYDPYMHGMYNGMECVLATVEGRTPDFRKPPEKWLHVNPDTETIVELKKLLAVAIINLKFIFDDQPEIDRLYDKPTIGGTGSDPGMCLKDLLNEASAKYLNHTTPVFTLTQP